MLIPIYLQFLKSNNLKQNQRNDDELKNSPLCFESVSDGSFIKVFRLILFDCTTESKKGQRLVHVFDFNERSLWGGDPTPRGCLVPPFFAQKQN